MSRSSSKHAELLEKYQVFTDPASNEMWVYIAEGTEGETMTWNKTVVEWALALREASSPSPLHSRGLSSGCCHGPSQPDGKEWLSSEGVGKYIDDINWVTMTRNEATTQHGRLFLQTI